MYKKIISVILALNIMILSLITAYSAESEAKTYSVYSDNMLFKQNEEAVIAGTAQSGTEITAELFDSNKKTVTSGKTAANNEGIFEVKFNAPTGSFEEYSIILKANGVEFETLENVVFGELWLASGQSNMQYPLAQAKHGVEMMSKGEKLSRNIRVLITPFFSELDNTIGKIPSEPQKDIPGAFWITGENNNIYEMSAVAYFFANKMTEELKMPVGILNVSLGGTTIASWISRESIESNEAVRNDFINYGKYVKLSEWDKTQRSIYYEMSANYNLRIEALKRFRLSGMIWYQGETDIGWTADAYSRAFDLLQSSYTELFNHSNGLLPIVFTQLAQYFYSDEGYEVPSRNIDFSEIQQAKPDSRALTSIYDVPITYLPAAGVIHPEHKLEVGERMAFAALGLVNNKYGSYTTATVEKHEIKDGSIYVTLKNIGEGLMQKGKILKGFSICGSDGIYVKADAEIIENNIVRITSNLVKKPVSAAYAYSPNNEKSNLYASHNGDYTLPVSPFITDRSIGTKYYNERTWADCDNAETWHTINDAYSGYYPSWKSENAELMLNSENAYSGEACLEIKATEKQFTVSPVMNFSTDDGMKTFYDADTDYSKYNSICLAVKNNGNSDIKIDKIKFYRNDSIWFSPSGATIPADNEWHTISFDINKLTRNGSESIITYSNDVLSDISNIEFVFTSESENAIVYVDNIRLSPGEVESEGLFEYIISLFIRFIDMIKKLFN